MSSAVDRLVEAARQRTRRTTPDQLDALMTAGALVVDIRPRAQRGIEGELPGAIVVDRNVLEWRLDPTGPHRLSEVTDFDRPVIVVCSEGYASSLAADSLRALGYRHASDLIGGYRALGAWPTTNRTTTPAHRQVP